MAVISNAEYVLLMRYDSCKSGFDLGDRTMKICVYCESSVSDEATKCPHCSSTSFIKQCPKCGKGYEGAECPDCKARDEAAKAAGIAAMQEEGARAKANSHLALKAVLTFIMPYIGGYFLINKNVKKGYRIAAIVWCILLACIAAPRSSTVGSSVIGTLMCLAPIAVYTIREKAWLWKEANSEVKITSVVLVVVLVFLLVSAVARGDRQPAQTESPSSASATAVSTQSSGSSASSNARPIKDGFDEKTNFAVQVAGVEYSFPDYYELVKGNGDMDYYYAERGGKVAMIGVQTDQASVKSESEFRSVQNTYIASVAKSISDEGFTVDSARDVKVAGLPGCVAELHGVAQNYDTQCVMLFFFNERESSQGVIALMQTDNTAYDYSADFEKIIASAKISSVDSDGGSSKSSSSSASAQAQEKEESSPSEAPSEEKSAASSGAPSKEEMLAALESNFPQDTAYRAATVSITNQMAADVFASDGNTLDPSKFHSFSDRSGFYLEPKGRGTWSYKDEPTWHVEGLEYKVSEIGTSVKASCDVHFDGTNYIISNQSGLIYNPGFEDWGTPLESYDTPSSDPARVVSPDLLS